MARIGRTGDSRLWLAAGAVLGIGLENKHSVGFLGLAVLGGALLTGREGRRLVLNWWFAAGAAIAAVFTIPDLWWQAQHGWATIAMTQQLNQENGGAGNIGNWVIGQLLMTAFGMLWVWFAGLKFLWRSDRPLWRALAWAYGLLFVFFMVTTGGKIYYEAGAYIYLLAAGAVAVDRRLAARGQSLRGILRGDGRELRGGVADRAAGAAGRRHWLDLQGELGGRGVAGLAAAGEQRPLGVDVAAGQPARARGDLHGRLRRGRRHRRTRYRPAAGGQRAQQLLVVGTRERGRDDRGRRGAGADGRHELRRLSAAVLQQRPGRGDAVQPLRHPQPGVGRSCYVCTGPKQPWAQIWPHLRHYD